MNKRMKIEIKKLGKVLQDEKKVSAIIIAANLFVLLMMLLMCFNRSVWIDETLDLEMIKHPYSYFLFTFRDAAPPFHFFILKIFVDLFGKIFPFIDYLYIAKFCSVVPYIIIFIVANTYCKNKWGAVAGSLSSLLTTTMPVMFGYGVEIRQYSWAILLAYIWFLSFCQYVVAENIKSAVVMTILGPLSLIAHYFTVFGVIYAYAFYCIYNLIKRRYKGICILLGVSLGSILLFVPWLLIAYKSIVKMAKNFWISQITIQSAVYSFFYPLMPDVTKFKMNIIGAILLFVTLAYLIYVLAKSDYDADKLILLIGLTMPFVIAITGAFIGRFIVSVFQPRYIMPIMACFWLSWAVVVIKKISSINIRVSIIILLMLIAVMDVSKNIKDEIVYKKNVEILSDFMVQDAIITAEQGGPNIAVDDGRVYNCLSYYTDKPYYGIGGSLENDYRDLVNRTKAGEEMYLIHSKENNNDNFFVNDMLEQGIKLDQVAECGIEYIDLVIYRLSY